MKIINLIKCEFIKQYTLSNIIIILLLLVTSVVGITEVMQLFSNQVYYNIPSSDADTQYRYYKEQYDSNPNVENAIYLNFYQHEKSMYDKLEEMHITDDSSWQYAVLNDLRNAEDDIYIASKIIENPNDPFWVRVKSEGYSFDKCLNAILALVSKSTDELEQLIKDSKNIKSISEELIEENKYYKYVEHTLTTHNYGGVELACYQTLIDNKVEDQNNYLSINCGQESKLMYNLKYFTPDYDEDDAYTAGFNSYERYVKFQNILKASKQEKTAIILYSTQNKIRHDITFGPDEGYKLPTYITAKTSVNQVLNLSIIVVIAVILTSGGVVSNEYKDGTNKMLLTSPIKRWKILLSKFLYLIIHSYIIWFSALLLMCIYAGIRFGFADLFTPKLIYYNDSVREVNYILYMIKDILVANIPIIAMLSIVLLISTITSNTSITVGITMILTVISPVMWYLIAAYKISFLAYTFLPYLDYWMVINNFEYYLLSLRVAPVGYWLGLMISLITIIVCYSIANFAYIRKDIKN